MYLKAFSTVAFIVIFYSAGVIGKVGRGSVRTGTGIRSSPRINVKPNNVYKPVNPSYRSSFSSSRGGVRWSSFGAGMLAYGVMSNLAGRSYHYNQYNYHNRNGYNNNKVATGSTCINNEDFNGTVFGTFVCPMPGFEPSAKYCCGSKEDQVQYCCTFFDDDGRRISTIIAVICIVGLVFCLLGCAIRLMKRERNFMKTNGSNVFVQSPPNVTHVNRNFGPRPNFPPAGPGPYPRPPQGTGPFYPGPNTPLTRTPQPESFPLINQNLNSNARPYPAQDSMPKPELVNVGSQPSAPPSYSDVVGFPQKT